LCLYKKYIEKKNTLTFKNKSLIVNFTSDKVLSLTTLVNYIHKIKKFENCKIFYKHQKLRKEKKINFSSKFINKLYLKKDKFFYNEIMKLIQYVKKFKKDE